MRKAEKRISRETSRLISIPGMVESIKAAALEKPEDCVPCDPNEPWGEPVPDK